MAADFRIKVRMYRQGLGDCFLLTLPKSDGTNYFIMIDCGVALGTPDAANRLTEVVADVVSVTGGKLDLVLATHEHWDHLSGFVQARDQFSRLKVDEIWLGWTEDPTDELATKLANERSRAVAALQFATARLQLAGDDETATSIANLLEFTGNSRGGASTTDALNALRGLSSNLRYRRPQDPPVDLGDPAARLYVLGPPRDERLIRMTLPTSSGNETYRLALQALFDNLVPAAADDGDAAQQTPFSPLYAIPTAVAQHMDFFSEQYWGTESWRRIDTDWLSGSAPIALQLDSATNNTCLVLAIELSNGDVLLFPGDAQVGNWLSWQDLSWTVDGKTVTGPDLLRRTVFYKVGHHGSYNATLRAQGLEMMDALRLAMVPVDHAMAVKKGWDRMPLPSLMDALTTKTQGSVVRADLELPNSVAQTVSGTSLFYEATL